MTDVNPYTAPATALQTGGTEIYLPSVFSFRGRIGRLRYLAYGVGFNLLLGIAMVPVLGVVAVLGAQAGMPAMSLAVSGIFYLASFVVSVIYSRRRLNDLNRSGWWFILFFIPIVNLLLAIYLVFFPGTNGPNDFGAAPAQNSLAIILLAILFPIILVGGIGILAAIAIPQYSDFTDRSKLAGTLAAAQPWKTAIAVCVAERGDLTNALCGTPGINGVPANAGAGELNYVTSITTTGAGVITVTSTAADESGQALFIVLTPSKTASGVEWVLSGNACNAIGRSLNC